jgi:hypothetical protein
MEPLRELLFFDAAKKEEQSKYLGVFKTSHNIPRFIAPLAGAVFILFFGATSAVWILTGIVSLLATWVLLSPARKVSK